jgi:hypothetical protein
MPDTPYTVTRRIDPLDHIGHDPRSLYAERFWLGHLGPSALWLLRLFAHHFDTTDTFTIDPVDIAHTIGLASSLSRLRKTIDRLERFTLLTTNAHDTITVRSALPWLPVADVHRLPDTLRIEHQHAVDAFNTTHPTHAELRDVAAHVASMRRRGTDAVVIAQVLAAWNVSTDTATAVLAA